MTMGKCIVLVTLLSLLLVLKVTECLFADDDCEGENSWTGKCKLLSKCNPLLDEVKNAGIPMPTRIRMKLQRLSCGFEGDQPLVCCPSSSVSDREPANQDINSDQTTKPFRDNFDSFNEVNNKDGEGPPDVTRHPRLKLLPTCCCGTIDDDRIWGGNATGLFEMPWMVLISYDSGRGTRLSCGGTLINERYVLTAAHCVAFLGSRLQLNGVLLGEHDVRQDPDCERNDGELQCAPNVRNSTIDRIIVHPGYTPQKLVDDIALIRLTEPADFSLDNMKAICLPVTPDLQNESLSGRQGLVAGWGATEDGVESPVLLSVQLPIVANKECQEAYKGTPRIYYKQMCAGGVRDRDSCGGDSGGPLLYPGRVGNSGARYVQRGIVSYGSKRCGVGGLPAVYTRVAYYMDWILDNMED